MLGVFPYRPPPGHTPPLQSRYQSLRPPGLDGGPGTHTWLRTWTPLEHTHTHTQAPSLHQSWVWCDGPAAGLVKCSHRSCLNFSLSLRVAVVFNCLRELLLSASHFQFCHIFLSWLLKCCNIVRASLAPPSGILQQPNALGVSVQFQTSWGFSLQTASTFPQAFSVLSGHLCVYTHQPGLQPHHFQGTTSGRKDSVQYLCSCHHCVTFNRWDQAHHSCPSAPSSAYLLSTVRWTCLKI